MDTKTVVDISGIHIGCQNCQLSQFCRPCEKSRLEMQLFAQINIRIHKYERGDHLYLANHKFKSVFVIRSGSVKTFAYAHGGEEQVTGFHLAGKMLGLDAIATGQHTQSAVALETCSVCEIPFAKLEEISAHTPQLQHLIFYVMSQEIRDDHYHLALLSRMPAAARLARFLLDLSRHFQQRGYSASNFNLSLSRHDIANLLGLAVETVSRLFTQFQEDGLLTADRKHIVLNNIAGLTKLSPTHSEHTRQKPAVQNEVC
jgi:CRP/FNR family transcriptional regulator